MYTIRIKINKTWLLLGLFLRWQFQDYPFSVNSTFEDILFQQVPANKPTILYMNFPCGRKYRKNGLTCQSKHDRNIRYGALMLLETVYPDLRFFRHGGSCFDCLQ